MIEPRIEAHQVIILIIVNLVIGLKYSKRLVAVKAVLQIFSSTLPSTSNITNPATSSSSSVGSNLQRLPLIQQLTYTYSKYL